MDAANKPPEDEPWAMYRDGDVSVGALPKGVSFDREVVEPFRERYEEMVSQDRVIGHVACLETEDSMGWTDLDGMQQAAEEGAEHGLKRWAIVTEGIKQYAVRNRVDVPELDVFVTEDFDEAMAWARGEHPEADTF